jgi:putative transposase
MGVGDRPAWGETVEMAVKSWRSRQLQGIIDPIAHWCGQDRFHLGNVGVQKQPLRSPNLQAYIERFIQSLQREALDYFIVFGEKHFDYLITEFVEHYHSERPHQAMGHQPLTGEWPEPEEPPPDGVDVVCRERLGGVLKHYHRRAA